MIEVARRFSFVREVGGANRGRWVQFIQRFTGNKPGESWCASFVSLVLNIVYFGNSPLKKSASCDVLLQQCREQGLIIPEPEPGCLVFSMASPNDAHHIAICTGADSNHPNLDAIAGNTSRDGKSNNGDGVYEHDVTRDGKVFARMPDLG